MYPSPQVRVQSIYHGIKLKFITNSSVRLPVTDFFACFKSLAGGDFRAVTHNLVLQVK